MTSEPYYREYFAGDAQAYAPARSVYGDGIEGQSTGAGGPQSATTYEGRFSTSTAGGGNNNNVVGGVIGGSGAGIISGVVVGGGNQSVHNPNNKSNNSTNHNNNNNNNNVTPVYAKTGVTAAGLTVDLPSPDSGIGTDAITPRDQNNIQQVSMSDFVA